MMHVKYSVAIFAESAFRIFHFASPAEFCLAYAGVDACPSFRLKRNFESTR